MGKRRGRNLKQEEKLVSITRTDGRGGPVTTILENLSVIIKNNNAPDSEEEGGLVRLTNEYLAWISPPSTEIEEGDDLHTANQKLKVMNIEKVRNTQRLFLIDETKNYN